MNYRPYPGHSTTRSAEVGSIPSGWEARRLKFAVSLRNEKIEAESADLEYMGLEHIESWTGKRIEDETASSEGIATRFEKEDVLFGKLRPYLAKVYLAEKEGMATTEALVMVCEPALSPAFLKHLLLSDKFIDAVSGTAYGAKMPRANWEDIGGLPILLPSHDEQQQIAAFLDWKTGQIDALIAKKKELLEKLKEKRLAVITQAVSKGLNPAAPLRDSGIPWLGQVPKHWSMLRIGRMVTLQRGVDITKDEQDEGDVPVVSSGGIASYHSVALVKGPGIVIGRKGTAGAIYYIDSDYWPHDTTLYVRECWGNHLRYVYYKLLSMDLASYDTGTANPTVNRNRVHPEIVSWPPLEEQLAIASYLDKAIKNIDAMTVMVTEAIARLTEYRTALITAATTGKIDVRDAIIGAVA